MRVDPPPLHVDVAIVDEQGEAPITTSVSATLKRMVADGFNENGEIVVPDCVCGALRSLVGQIDALDQAIGAIDRELAASVKADETAKRLMTIPGVGPVTASAIVATIQDAGVFASEREFAAFLGLTPRQNSTGSKTRLGRITKVGDRYLQRPAESSGNYMNRTGKVRNEMCGMRLDHPR